MVSWPPVGVPERWRKPGEAIAFVLGSLVQRILDSGAVGVQVRMHAAVGATGAFVVAAGAQGALVRDTSDSSSSLAWVRLCDSVSSGDCAAVMACAAAPVLACPWRMSRTLLRFGDGR